MRKNTHEEKREQLLSRHNSVANWSTIFWALIGLCIGVFMLFYAWQFAPIKREAAITYTGEFASYEGSDSSKQDSVVSFRDGSRFYVNLSCEDQAFLDAMGSMEVGTPLHLLVHSGSTYVLEMRTDTAELLNFQAVQHELRVDWIAWLALGGIVCICGVSLIAITIMAFLQKHREKKDEDQQSGTEAMTESVVLRYADLDVKCRILLEERIDGYHICYRRVKSVNELVVNGRVYDEKKGILEFEHTLRAVIDGHRIEAGLDALNWSFISFDGALVGYKQRIF